MKTIILALTATVLGSAVGVALTYNELTSVGNVGLGSPVDVLELGSATIARQQAGIPRLAVEGEREYDFGVMERGTTSSHAFVIKNEGRGPLRLEKGETSCKCTLSELTNGSLSPGESTEITLEWTPKEYEPVFHQTAEIRTNDPLTPILTLTIRGKVIQSVRTSPESIALGSIPLNKPTLTEVKLFSYADHPLEVTEIEWALEEIASYFSAEVVDMPREVVETDPDAKGGKLVKIRIESGLPLGPINQKIRLTTNLLESPVIEVPLTMNVTGDVSIVGRGYSNESATLMLGRIKSEKGYVARLNVLVKGPDREGTEVSVGEVKPADVLKVTLGEKKQVKNGEIYMIPLEIAIPAGSRSASHISTNRNDQGSVVLETNHPEAKRIEIAVRFAVE